MHCFGIRLSFTKEVHLYEERLTGAFCCLFPSSSGRDDESIPAHLGPPPHPGNLASTPARAAWQPTGSWVRAPPGREPDRHAHWARIQNTSTRASAAESVKGQCTAAGSVRSPQTRPGPRWAAAGRGRLRSRSRNAQLSSAQARGPRRPAPRLGRSQEAPRAGFQSDARDREAAGLSLPRSRAEQVTARPGLRQSLLLKPWASRCLRSLSPGPCPARAAPPGSPWSR